MSRAQRIILFLCLVAGAQSLAASARADNAAPELVQRLSETVKKTRDPFRRIIKATLAEKRPDLQSYPADQFRLTGVVTGFDRLRAMLVGPNSKTYFVTENTPIGLRKGVIKKISPDQIVIQERLINPLGDEESVSLVLRLSAGDEVGKKASAQAAAH